MNMNMNMNVNNTNEHQHEHEYDVAVRMMSARPAAEVTRSPQQTIGLAC